METKICPQCGKPVPLGAALGLCPECMLKVGVGSTLSETAPAEGPAPRRRDRFEAPSPGVLADMFPQLEILELLGQGGMGAVYKARQKGLDRWVALKILPPESETAGSFAERFTREARALARLSHPNIVSVYDFGRAGGYFYLLMEFIDGVNLRQMLQAQKLSPREALGIVPQICEALQFAHDEGIVHRDIKPENILIDRRGRVKIADFGLARLLGVERPTERLTRPADVMGTPQYMAPEQLEKPLEVDHRADIYSLGVVFYEMLTGELPLGRFAPPSRKVQVDVRLDEVVLRALEKEPELRYQQASQFKHQVETVAQAEPAGSPTRGAEPAATTSRATAFSLRPEHKPALVLGLVIVGVLLLPGTLPIAPAFVGLISGLFHSNLPAALTALAGLGAFAWGLGRLWKNHHHLLGAFGIQKPPSNHGAEANGHPSIDRWLYWTAVAVLAIVVVRVGSVLLLTATSVLGYLLAMSQVADPMVGFSVAGLAAVALCAWFGRKKMTPAASVPGPGWLTRWGVGFLALGALSLLPVFLPFQQSSTFNLEGRMVHTTVRFYGSIGPIELITGIALLTRGQAWRTAALVLSWVGLLLWLTLNVIPTVRPDVMETASTRTTGWPFVFCVVGIIHVLAYAAGILILNRKEVVSAFGLAEAESPKKGFTLGGFIRAMGAVLALLLVALLAYQLQPTSRKVGTLLAVPTITGESGNDLPQPGSIDTNLPSATTHAPVTDAPFPGVQVELVAIGPHPSNGQRGWRQDGSSASEGPFEIQGASVDAGENEIAREFIFKVRGVDPETASITFKSEPSGSGWAGGSWPLLEKQPAPDFRAVEALFPKDTRTANVTLGVAASPWQPVTQFTGRTTTQRVCRHQDAVWRFSVAPAVEDKEGNTQLTVNHDVEGWDLRFVAVDELDQEHLGARSGGVGGMLTSHFHALHLADIKFFRVEVRPHFRYHFPNVPLNPGTPPN